VAVGFSLIYRTTRVINIAQGDMGAFAGYVAWTLYARWSWPIAVVLLVVPLLVGAGAVVVERLAFRPLYGRGFLPPVISAIGLSFILQSLVVLIWGPVGKSFPPFLNDRPFRVAGISLVPQALWIILVGLVLALVIHQGLATTKVGRAMRTTAHSPSLARLLGVPAERMFATAFFVAGVLSAVAGILVAPTTYMQPTMGLTFGLSGFIAATIGGLGNVGGAFVGGLLIGVLGNVSTLYVDPRLHDVVTYALFAVFLMVRPTGLFGEEGVGVRDV
jgi:branched-chain amino acid transport system permease protein